MVTVNKFLCFRLHTAGVIIGWIGCVTSVLNIVVNLIIIANLDVFLQHMSVTVSDYGKSVIEIALGVYVVINSIDCISSALLIAGTIKEKPLLLVPWLLTAAADIFFNSLNLIISIVYLTKSSEDILLIIGTIAVGIIILLAQYWLFVVVHSLYKVQRMSSEKQCLINTTHTSKFPDYTQI